MRAVTSVTLLAVIFVTAFAAGRWSAPERKPEVVEVVRVDTLRVRDTVKVVRPEVVEVRTVDTMRVAVVDTLRVRDTVYMELPREQVRWSEEGVADVWASGWHPAVDSVKVYRETKVVTVEVRQPPKRWGIGVQAGYGLGANGLQPYVGVGVSWNMFEF